MSLARTGVGLDVGSATEDLQGRVAGDFLSLTQVLFGGAVDLSEGNALRLELGGRLFVLGGEGFAVTAPWREDLTDVSVGEQIHSGIAPC